MLRIRCESAEKRRQDVFTLFTETFAINLAANWPITDIETLSQLASHANYVNSAAASHGENT